MRDADADLVVAGVGRLVSEQEEIESLVACLDRVGERGGRRLRAPVAPVGLEKDGVIDAHRQRVLQLFDCSRRAERDHGRLPAVGPDNPKRLLHRTLFVRRDREAEQARVDRLLVGRERDPRSRVGDALDAREHVQLRTRVFSGSNSERLPLTATVTG